MAFSYNDIAQTEVGGGRALPGQQAVAELRFGTPECAAAQLPVSEGTISSESRESLVSDHPGRFLLIYGDLIHFLILVYPHRARPRLIRHLDVTIGASQVDVSD